MVKITGAKSTEYVDPESGDDLVAKKVARVRVKAYNEKLNLNKW